MGTTANRAVRNRRPATVFAGALLALQGGAWGQVWNPDLDREYVAAGRTGVTALPIARAENHFQARDQVAIFATRDSLYVQVLQQACTIKVCGNTCQLQDARTLATALPGPREAGPPVIGFGRVWPAGSADRTATVAIARPGGMIHVRTYRLDTGIQEVGRDSLRLGDLGGRDVRGFAPDRVLADSSMLGTFFALGTGGLFRTLALRPDGGLAGETRLDLPATVSGRVLSHGFLGTEDGRILALGADASTAAPTTVAGPFGKAIVRLDGRTALLADGTWLFNVGDGWSGPHSVAGGADGVLAVPTLAGTVFRTYRNGASKESLPADHSGFLVMPSVATVPEPVPSPLRTDRVVKFGGGEMDFSIRLVDVDGISQPPAFVNFGGDYLMNLNVSPAKPLVRTHPGVGCMSPGLCIEGTDIELAVRLRDDSILISLPVMDNAGYDPNCPNPGFAGKPALLKSGVRWQRDSEIWIAFGRDTLALRFGNRPPPLSIRRGSPTPVLGISGPAAMSRLRWLSPRGLRVDAVGRAGD